MSRAVSSTKATIAKIAAVGICTCLALVVVLELSTTYLYLLLFAAGTGAFFMIGYQVWGMMREENPELAAKFAGPSPAAPTGLIGILSPNDRIILDWARECFDSGNTLEAGSKLESISAACRNHPEVLKLRHQIYFVERRWHAALDVAKAWSGITPNDTAAWEAQAACLGEMRQYQAALEMLVPIAARFPKSNTIPYRLAQICAEMGRLEQAQGWLFRALDGGEKNKLIQRAMQDAALEPLIHFLGRKALVESLFASDSDSAGLAVHEFAGRRGITRVRCDASGIVAQGSAPAARQYDGTVIFADKAQDNDGIFKAVELAQLQRRPYILIRKDKADADPVAEFLTFIEQHRILGLRIAGDATQSPSMKQFVKETLDAAFDYQLRSLLRGTVTPASLRG